MKPAPNSNEFFQESISINDEQSNRAVAAIIGAFIVTLLVWDLVGNTNPRNIKEAYLYFYGSIAQMAAVLALCIVFKEKSWMKYLLIASLMCSSFLLSAGVDYRLLLTMLLPVVASSIYYNLKLTVAVMLLGLILMLAGLLINNNYVPIVIGLYYKMTAWEKLMRTIGIAYVFDMLVFLLISIGCIYATHHGRNEIIKQAQMRGEMVVYDKEVNTAKGIQEGMLNTSFPCGEWCDVSASMTAAKDVGGDFYDCFRVGDDRLAFVIADVSGKGLPAAMFMASSLTLIRSNVQEGIDLAIAIEKANRELESHNSMKYFVTMWIGVMDLRTGKVVYIDAGHNPPFVKKGGKYSILECKPDFVFGRKKKIRYNKQYLKLEPGDSIFLYTDGVTEAVGPGDKMFGEEHLGEVLNSCTKKTSKETIQHVWNAVSDFMKEESQADDITMMSVQFKHPYDVVMDEGITVRADSEGYRQMMSRLEVFLKGSGCSTKTMSEMQTVCSELFANIDMYSYEGMEKGNVRITMDVVDSTIRITFTDWGIPFNPLGHDDPDPEENFNDRVRGGLGIIIVKKACDNVTYTRVKDCNIIKLEKEI